MAIYDVTTKRETFFNMYAEELADRCNEYNDRMNIIMQIHPEATLIVRQVYNSFMLFGDVGGFLGLLIGLGSICISFLNFANAENYVAQSIYKSRPSDRSKEDERLDPRK